MIKFYRILNTCVVDKGVEQNTKNRDTYVEVSSTVVKNMEVGQIYRIIK